jgi:hypothetical protein
MVMLELPPGIAPQRSMLLKRIPLRGVKRKRSRTSAGSTDVLDHVVLSPP